jgi:hypothetical protein
MERNSLMDEPYTAEGGANCTLARTEVGLSGGKAAGARRVSAKGSSAT